ncbi:putative aldehyde dehydrogenase [Frankia canadensis]|uniref:aldehyde dehydrogenase (NAD(+)) n=1 Tax=Frankia canadensis TaxID=1836972 RepID=A0A2I2KQP8_9ACTN|nr:aldehyde dehydrogenase family protein [Frankia canadensis]SNQ47979.1 putative aldehyde dehydrogenase [Frankia canadensis]SOU55269.1 putative aldehyde dehydrogenase [Frankia canadensis]
MPTPGLTVADPAAASPGAPSPVRPMDAPAAGLSVASGPTVTGHYVDGVLVEGARSGGTPVHDPATGELIGVTGHAGPATVARALAAARAAAPGWAARPLAERMRYLDAWRERLAAAADALTELVVDELGLIPEFARRVHVGRAVGCLEHLGELAEAVLTPRREGTSLVVREPAGVVAAITAWNFPLHMLVSKISSAIALGNTVVIKPSEIKSLAAWAATRLLAQVGLPPGVVNVVGGTGPEVGAALVAHPDVDMISFTGSREVGRSILATTATTITRSVLELGGKNPALLLPDASLDEALPGVLGSCLFNNGQVCGAQSRLIVPRALLAEVEERVAEIVDRTVVGPPRAAGTGLGPVVSAAQQARVSGFIADGLSSGLRLLRGGLGLPEGLPASHHGGYYLRPTVFTDVAAGHRLAQEEIFGPVLTILACDNVDDMVAVANGTRYGLTAAVWSADLDRSIAVARRLNAGQVVVNGGAFNLAAPYGGVRESGNGREHGREGLAELTEVKSLQLPA